MKIAIILVNWNRSIDTINCINSIKSSNYKDYKIIVIDNNSSEHQKSILNSVENNCEIHYLKKNTGYTGGNNYGIKIALEYKAEYVFLLNNDTYLADNTLAVLSKTLEDFPEAGVVSPKIYFYPETNILWSGAPRFNNSILMGYLSGYGEIDCGQCNQFEYVDYVSGCAMMVRASVFQSVGLLSDKFFAVCEDLDFCFKVKLDGSKIAYNPQAIVYHLESASSGGTDAPQYVYYQTRNYFLFHNIWSKTRLQLLISQTYYFLFVTKRSFNFILDANWKSFLAIIFGIFDYLFGRFGARTYKILSK